MAYENPEGEWELEYFSSICTHQEEEYGLFSLVNECYQHCVCFLWRGKPSWVISEAVTKLACTNYWCLFRKQQCRSVVYSLCWFCSEFQGVLISFRLAGLLSDSWRAVFLAMSSCGSWSSFTIGEGELNGEGTGEYQLRDRAVSLEGQETCLMLWYFWVWVSFLRML